MLLLSLKVWIKHSLGCLLKVEFALGHGSSNLHLLFIGSRLHGSDLVLEGVIFGRIVHLVLLLSDWVGLLMLIILMLRVLVIVLDLVSVLKLLLLVDLLVLV